MLVGSLAATVSPISAGYLADQLGSRSPFVLAAVVASIACVFCLVFLRRAPQNAPAAKPRLLGVLHHPRVRAAVVLTAVAAMVGNAVALLVTFQLGEAGLSATEIGIVFGASSALLVLGSLVVTVAGERGTTVRVGAVATLLLALSMIPLALTGTVVAIVAFAVVKSLFIAVMYTVAYPMAASAGVGEAAAALSFLALVWGVGALAGPLVAAALEQSVGVELAYAVLAAATLAATVVSFAEDRRSTGRLRPVEAT
jgi:predicted MFS family arabinose efflux permease